MADMAKEISIGDIGTRDATADEEFHGEKLTINMGPSHPATHGVLRLHSSSTVKR
jgi:NADH-quinone oxidoreductase subunit D